MTFLITLFMYSRNASTKLFKSRKQTENPWNTVIRKQTLIKTLNPDLEIDLELDLELDLNLTLTRFIMLSRITDTELKKSKYQKTDLDLDLEPRIWAWPWTWPWIWTWPWTCRYSSCPPGKQEKSSWKTNIQTTTVDLSLFNLSLTLLIMLSRKSFWKANIHTPVVLNHSWGWTWPWPCLKPLLKFSTTPSSLISQVKIQRFGN